MLAAVSMWKDEADIGPTVIRHLLAEGVDHIIVADNLSSDGTTEHLCDFIAKGAPLTRVEDPDPGYRQAEKMTRLAHMAGEMGADWVIPFDADELWYSPHGRLADVLETAVDPVQWVEGFYHVPHPDDDASEADPVRRMTHRRRGRDCPQSKVCFRYRPGAQVAQGNHDVNISGPRGSGLIAFREFQYRSFDHMRRKVRNGKAAYDAAPEVHPLCGIHWRRLGAMSDEDLWAEWEAYLATPTDYDPAPLRTTEVPV